MKVFLNQNITGKVRWMFHKKVAIIKDLNKDILDLFPLLDS